VTLKDYMNPERKAAKAFTNQWSNMVPSLLGDEFSTGFDLEKMK